MRKYEIQKCGDTGAFYLPESWDEVSPAQYKALLKIGGEPYPDVATLAVMSKLPVEFWQEYNNYSFFQNLLSKIDFLNDVPNFTKEPGKEFRIINTETVYEIEPETIVKSSSVAQYEDCKALGKQLQKAEGDYEKIIDTYVQVSAILLFPITESKPYNYKEATRLVPIFSQHASIVDVMRLGNFFLRRLNVSEAGTKARSEITKALRWIPGIGLWKRLVTRG